MELVDERLLLQHTADREGERDSDRRGQTLGDSRDSDSDARHQHIEDVLAAEDSRRKYSRAHDEADYRHDPAELREPLLQGSQLLVDVGEEVGDTPHLRASARRDDACPTRSADG